ncbi:MAG: hypothetical protein ABR583_14630 [Gaiellaceae bacterium]
MDAPTTHRREAAQDKPTETMSGTSASRVPGLSRLPDLRPRRRLFGLIRGRREA